MPGLRITLKRTATSWRSNRSGKYRLRRPPATGTTRLICQWCGRFAKRTSCGISPAGRKRISTSGSQSTSWSCARRWAGRSGPKWPPITSQRKSAPGWEAVRREGAQVHGLHVVASESQLETDAAQALQIEFNRRCEEADVRGTLAVEAGEVAAKICERALLADLVVLHLAHPPPR